MSSGRITTRIVHPYALNSLALWLDALRQYGGIAPRYLVKAIVSTVLSMMTSPLRLAERVFFKARVDSTSITEPPVFILGHWRTGTTFLHDLMVQDKETGYVSLFQTIAPESFFVGQKTLQPLAALGAPKTRPMDNVVLRMGGPQEEEFGMANSCGLSFYVGWFFPKSMERLFDRYALLEGLSEGELAEWRHSYLYLLKAATRQYGGKRLVLKNPVNTCRIGAILELFPDAKFVHICRDPFEVFKSSLRLYRSVLDLVSLQTIDDDRIEEYVLKFYRQMMQQYLGDRDKIPAGNLVEVRYENLDENPVREIERIYEELALPGWDGSREEVAAYARAKESYTKNEFRISAAEIETVEKHWKFAIEAWGYQRPIRATEG